MGEALVVATLYTSSLSSYCSISESTNIKSSSFLVFYSLYFEAYVLQWLLDMWYVEHEESTNWRLNKNKVLISRIYVLPKIRNSIFCNLKCGGSYCFIANFTVIESLAAMSLWCYPHVASWNVLSILNDNRHLELYSITHLIFIVSPGLVQLYSFHL